MKGFIKSLLTWETLLLVGIMSIFVAGGWYAWYYEGDNETAKYASWIVIIVGGFFIIASFISHKKKIKRNKEIDQKYGKD